MNEAIRDTKELDLIDLSVVISQLVAKRKWIAISVVFFSAVFVGAAFMMRPVYRSSTLLAPASAERQSGGMGAALGQLGGIAALAGISVGSGDLETEEALAVLRSREFTKVFIDRQGLMPKLFADHWDSTRGQWLAGKSSPPSAAAAFRHFDKIRHVVEDKKSGLISLQIEWTDPVDAANWANALVTQLNEVMRGRAISRANEYLTFLQNELKSTETVEARAAIGRLIEAQIKQRMLANVSQEYAFRVVDLALPADADDPVRPNKLLMFIFGPITGLAVGAIVVLVGMPFARVRRTTDAVDSVR